MDFVVQTERDLENAKYVLQWTKEQHRGAMEDEDMLHLVIEDSQTHSLVGYAIIAGLKNYDRNIELKRIA